MHGERLSRLASHSLALGRIASKAGRESSPHARVPAERGCHVVLSESELMRVGLLPKCYELPL